MSHFSAFALNRHLMLGNRGGDCASSNPRNFDGLKKSFFYKSQMGRPSRRQWQMCNVVPIFALVVGRYGKKVPRAVGVEDFS